MLAAQISLPDFLYFLRYWSICVLQLFFNQVVMSNFEIDLTFLFKPFFDMIKNSRQRCKYFENKKNF